MFLGIPEEVDEGCSHYRKCPPPLQNFEAGGAIEARPADATRQSPGLSRFVFGKSKYTAAELIIPSMTGV